MRDSEDGKYETFTDHCNRFYPSSIDPAWVECCTTDLDASLSVDVFPQVISRGKLLT